MTGIEDLEVMGALRFVDYNTFGTHWSWKVGGRYKPIRDLALRGTYSTAFRAPNIVELYGGATESFPAVSDPCQGPNIDPNSTRGRQCRAEGPNVLNNGDDSSQQKERLGGNPALQPETATTWTTGFVYEPSYLKGFALTADYYAIDVKNVITALGAAFIVNACYPGDPALAPKYCDLIRRDPNTGTIALISDLQANISSIKTAGIDVSVNYRLPSYSFGQFQFLFSLAWLQYYDQTQPDGTVIHGKGTADLLLGGAYGGLFPEWKFNTGVNWNLEGFGAGLSTRFLSSVKECGTPDGLSGGGLCSQDSTYSRKISAYNVWDMFVAYTLKSSYGSTNFVFGMNNIFNTFPPAVYNNTFTGSDPSGYDYMGRFFYFRLGQSI
jgi:outer membrane receptor protein involved in Fe transport